MRLVKQTVLLAGRTKVTLLTTESVVGSLANTYRQYFHEFSGIHEVTVSGKVFDDHQLDDNLLQVLILRDFRVSYRPKNEQIFKHNYTFFNNIEFKKRN